MTWPYNSDESDLGITHADGYLEAPDVVSTMPDVDGGTGEPKPIIVRKPLP
jgi:hypothetical protein